MFRLFSITKKRAPGIHMRPCERQSKHSYLCMRHCVQYHELRCDICGHTDNNRKCLAVRIERPDYITLSTLEQSSGMG